MNEENLARVVLEAGDGILRLAPTWVAVPQSIGSPGGRLKLVPQDLYAFGVEKGGICERWIASTLHLDLPGAPPDLGLSYIVHEEDGEVKRISLKRAIELLGEEYLGEEVMRKYGGLKAFTKFFDYAGPLPLHLHHRQEHAEKVGKDPKPEGYYFPPQMNFNEGRFPYTFFGLEPGTTREDIIRCLKRWNKGDNQILDYSRAYRIRPGTSWIVPAGILHAPGSLLTYEPQRTSDVFAMFQSKVEERMIPWGMLVKDVPEDLRDDLNYITDLIDWDKNLDPEFKRKYHLKHVPVKDPDEMREEGYYEKWIVYGLEDFSAKELTIFPGKRVIIRDAMAYGMIIIQGRGRIGKFYAEAPTMIRFGELTNDEFFVTWEAARDGVEIENMGKEDLIILKNFGPGNPDAPKLKGLTE